MDSSPLDAAPIEGGLARAFDLPPFLAEDERLVDIHSDVVAKLRREAQGLSMNTVQQLLLERIAFNYVYMLYKENEGGFAKPSEQKDFNAFWLSMTTEFNKMLLKSGDKLREALLQDISKILQESLPLIQDEADRKTVRRTIAEQLAAINL
jgi:hypothetical protein